MTVPGPAGLADGVSSLASGSGSSGTRWPASSSSTAAAAGPSSAAGGSNSAERPLLASLPKLVSPDDDSFIGRTTSWLGGKRMSRDEVDELLWNYRTVFSAGSASLVSTAASFPFDSLKSRLQVKYYPSIWACGKAVMREEGMKGFFRGVWIPLITISFVRTSSFSIYVGTKDALHTRGIFTDQSLLHTAASGMSGGATSGMLISCGSAPFELVKVQRQLEYLTAVQRGLVSKVGSRYVARSGYQAALDIWRHHGGPRGFYLGFPLHICRDTIGTALYFGFYDTTRALVGRYSTGTGGRNGSSQLFGLPGPVVSFLSGSTAGIASWLLVYPVDLLKTNVQQRALSGQHPQMSGTQLFKHLMRARPPKDGASDSAVARFLRLYRGLGVSAVRSFISHGLTWMIIEGVSQRISERVGPGADGRPRQANEL